MTGSGKNTRGFSRRVILAGAAIAAAQGIPASAVRRPAQDAGRALVAALSDPGAAARLARTRGWQAMGSREALAAQVLGDLERDLPGATQTGGDAIRGRLAQLIRRDFAAGRTLAADRWLVAVTEARLCAIAAHDRKAGA